MTTVDNPSRQNSWRWSSWSRHCLGVSYFKDITLCVWNTIRRLAYRMKDNWFYKTKRHWGREFTAIVKLSYALFNLLTLNIMKKALRVAWGYIRLIHLQCLCPICEKEERRVRKTMGPVKVLPPSQIARVGGEQNKKLTPGSCSLTSNACLLHLPCTK